ncbi:Lipid phosphate phosphohydrolase 2 [Sciurus carolinensis]|uniref:Lipid phosphate phosphohydrolase 2 n=1 Tax=Sciurus carolinensis TaxID=30640 RepID=A0AA41T5L2_SCICA|nr:Lipid phosphate phosphohydrolase 2 [Sciurus carolinensis]
MAPPSPLPPDTSTHGLMTGPRHSHRPPGLAGSPPGAPTASTPARTPARLPPHAAGHLPVLDRPGQLHEGSSAPGFLAACDPDWSRVNCWSSCHRGGCAGGPADLAAAGRSALHAPPSGCAARCSLHRTCRAPREGGAAAAASGLFFQVAFALYVSYACVSSTTRATSSSASCRDPGGWSPCPVSFRLLQRRPRGPAWRRQLGTECPTCPRGCVRRQPTTTGATRCPPAEPGLPGGHP